MKRSYHVGPQASTSRRTSSDIRLCSATALGVTRPDLSALLNERAALSPEMALRLSALFGNSPEFWLNLQRAVDLWDAQAAVKDDVRRIKPLCVA